MEFSSGNTDKRRLLALAAVATVFVLFSAGALTGRMAGGTAMSGLGWMWIPAALAAGLGALLVVSILGKRQ